MSHVRTQVVDEVVDVLTGLTTTGGSIFAGQVYATGDDVLPCLCVYTNAETCEFETMQVQRRVITLAVEGRVKATSGADEALDDIAAEVETAMFADQFLDGLTQGIDLVSTEKDFSAEGEMETASITLLFHAHILTAPGAPEIAL